MYEHRLFDQKLLFSWLLIQVQLMTFIVKELIFFYKKTFLNIFF